MPTQVAGVAVPLVPADSPRAQALQPNHDTSLVLRTINMGRLVHCPKHGASGASETCRTGHAEPDKPSSYDHGSRRVSADHTLADGGVGDGRAWPNELFACGLRLMGKTFGRPSDDGTQVPWPRQSQRTAPPGIHVVVVLLSCGNPGFLRSTAVLPSPALAPSHRARYQAALASLSRTRTRNRRRPR